jgi:hypothetical protein
MVMDGQNVLRIKDSQIFINGENYGEVKRGDSFLLRKDGEVFVKRKNR